MKRWGMVLLLLSAVLVAATRGPLDRMGAAMRSERDLLYLPNGRYLRLLSLGHQAALADWMYIWAIQYYSNYERADRYRYVEHLFGEVIAELDPNYVDAYWLGALILSVEARDVDAALRLLDKGIHANPDQWVLPYLAAWECFHAGRYDEAGRYFAAAADIPGAPAQVVRMRAGAIARAGDLGDAIALWGGILEDPSSDEAERTIAKRQVRTLTVKRDVRRIREAVADYRERHGRNPTGLLELLRAGLLRDLPLDPDGEPYRYDPDTGAVSSTAGRMLGDY